MRFDLRRASVRMGSRILLLTVPDESPSPPREVPLRYIVTESGVELLAPRLSVPRWARALRTRASVSWRIDDRWVEGVAEEVQDAQAVDRIRRRFEDSFGGPEVRRWFGEEVLGFRLRPVVRGSADSGDPLATYFDRLAPRYEALVRSNPLDAYLRTVSQEFLVRSFSAGDRILEIGCGTGLETIPLAKRGVRVLAVDVSAEMLGRLSDAATREGVADRIQTRQLRAARLRELLSDFGPGSFDGAFSNFGAMNCEPSLRPVAEALHELLRPRGKVVLGIWNRFCAADAVLSIAARKPRRLLTRLEGSVPVGESRFGVPVRAIGPGEARAIFDPSFETLGIVGLPVFVPPYDFAAALRNRPNLLDILTKIDARLAGGFPFSHLGDHFLLLLRRRDDGTRTRDGLGITV